MVLGNGEDHRPYDVVRGRKWKSPPPRGCNCGYEESAFETKLLRVFALGELLREPAARRITEIECRYLAVRLGLPELGLLETPRIADASPEALRQRLLLLLEQSRRMLLCPIPRHRRSTVFHPGLGFFRIVEGDKGPWIERSQVGTMDVEQLAKTQAMEAARRVIADTRVPDKNRRNVATCSTNGVSITCDWRGEIERSVASSPASFDVEATPLVEARRWLAAGCNMAGCPVCETRKMLRHFFDFVKRAQWQRLVAPHSGSIQVARRAGPEARSQCGSGTTSYRVSAHDGTGESIVATVAPDGTFGQSINERLPGELWKLWTMVFRPVVVRAYLETDEGWHEAELQSLLRNWRNRRKDKRLHAAKFPIFPILDLLFNPEIVKYTESQRKLRERYRRRLLAYTGEPSVELALEVYRGCVDRGLPFTWEKLQQRRWFVDGVGTSYAPSWREGRWEGELVGRVSPPKPEIKRALSRLSGQQKERARRLRFSGTETQP